MSILGSRSLPDGSPCAGVCTQSVGDYVCTTCGRTIPETRDWNAYDREKRLLTKQRARARLIAIRAGADAGDEASWDLSPQM
jgi:predicted Fe-S protein YdhL (DUF1289 family)